MDTRLLRSYFAPTIFACAVPTFCLLGQTPLRAAEPTSSSTEEQPGHPDSDRQSCPRKSIGVWTREAVPRGWVPNVMGTEYKFFTDKYWVVTHADKSGFAIYAHGGTYELEGDKQIGTIVFSTLYNAGMIGQSHECKIDIDNNIYWQIGIDNDYTEKWTRADGGEKSQVNRDLIGVWTHV